MISLWVGEEEDEVFNDESVIKLYEEDCDVKWQ